MGQQSENIVTFSIWPDFIVSSQSSHTLFWEDAILSATYIISRMPTPLLKGKTPLRCFFHKKPKYDNLQIFGCLCFASTHHHRPSNFDVRIINCIFLGYAHGQKGYNLNDLSTSKSFVSRDVLFHENTFHFHHLIGMHI